MGQRGARNRRAEGAAFGGRHVNFLHLKYFLMVAEELNITRAAERLYISQQSLSNHISNMERELNVKLFTRSPKLALTYAGDLLVDTATQILDRSRRCSCSGCRRCCGRQPSSCWGPRGCWGPTAFCGG